MVMTNNVKSTIGYIYATDRNASSLDILQLMGPAKYRLPPGN
jgi:hypothetical protein